METLQTSGALNVASDAAIEAGKIIAQSITQLDRIQISQKSRNEMVTEIDIVAEQKIIAHLEESYPLFSIEAKQSGNKDRVSEFCWIIDPLNGTHNFIHGHPHCAVSIALRQRDDIVLAVVYDPLRNELFSTRKGSGAQLDGRRIRVSETPKISDGLLGTGFPNRGDANTKPWLRTFALVLPRAQTIHRSGCPALDMAYVAAGRYDGFWQFGLEHWSTAAGSLLIKEAGGLISDINGDSDLSKSGNLVAGNARTHEKLRQLVSHTG